MCINDHKIQHLSHKRRTLKVEGSDLMKATFITYVF